MEGLEEGVAVIGAEDMVNVGDTDGAAEGVSYGTLLGTDDGDTVDDADGVLEGS